MGRKDDKLSNFLPINRKFFQHPFWKERRTFSKAEAWLWLIAEARFDATVASELIGGKMIKWVRGEVPVSLRYLGDVWSWEKNQVDRFLKVLEREQMIKRRIDQGQSIIKLINYEAHNGLRQVTQPESTTYRGEQDSGNTGTNAGLGQQTGQQNAITAMVSKEQQDTKRDRDGTATGQAQDNTNIVNIENNDNCADGTIHSQDDIEKFKAFKQWIAKYAPRIDQLKNPITIDQYKKLREDFNSDSDREVMKHVMQDMHNSKTLLKKYESANLTLRSWMRIRKQNMPQTKQLGGTNDTSDIAKQILATKQKELGTT